MFGFYLTLDGSRNGTSIPKAVARCFGWHILTNANNIQLCLRKMTPWASMCGYKEKLKPPPPKA